MKFKYTGIIEVEPLGDNVQVVVTRGDGYFYFGHECITIDDIKEHFIPADNDALNLMDPDRTERLCRPGG